MSARPVLIAVIALQACGAARTGPPRPADSAPLSVTGTYAFHHGSTAGCSLMVGQTSDTTLRIRLDCNRGAPSYHMGILAASVPFSDSVAIYRTEELGSLCEIRFTFHRQSMEARQTGTDGACGFGYGVYADGRYRRVSYDPPLFDVQVNPE